MDSLSLKRRKEVFVDLGEVMSAAANNSDCPNSVSINTFSKLTLLIKDHIHYNPWFVEENVRMALRSFGDALASENLEKWLSSYPKLDDNEKLKKVAVVMAGNIPMVGFHDFLSVLISGNILLAKMSSDDNRLLPLLFELLCEIEPAFSNRVEFVEGTVKNADAYIATGSGNTARYFAYYFGKKPHIIRRNRNAVAIIDGNENESDFEAFTSDIFSYFGLGCRNVSKIFLPENYPVEKLAESIFPNEKTINHHKYFNNYEYRKAILLINGVAHYDNGGLLLQERDEFGSSISVLHYSFYKNQKDVSLELSQKVDQLQCVVSRDGNFPGSIKFGEAQNPQLWDYADGVDTMVFLSEL